MNQPIRRRRRRRLNDSELLDLFLISRSEPEAKSPTEPIDTESEIDTPPAEQGDSSFTLEASLDSMTTNQMTIDRNRNGNSGRKLSLLTGGQPLESIYDKRFTEFGSVFKIPRELI